LPFSYLVFVYQIKLVTYQEVRSNQADNTSNIVLLPQPFSPLYWQVIKQKEDSFSQAYVRLANDPVVLLISSLLGKKQYQENFQSLKQLRWKNYFLVPKNIHLQSEANRAWNHAAFSAFRNFAVYPVYYPHKKTKTDTCIWFSDLRYHWPDFLPWFRYGMCRKEAGNWTVHRMKN
jgi:inner membrane protein